MISLTRSQLEANIDLHKAAQMIETAYRATSLVCRRQADLKVGELGSVQRGLLPFCTNQNCFW